MMKMLDEAFGLKRAMMTTIHAYTADQPLADVAGADLRRSRSAVENIIPNTTRSPELVKKIMPQFEGKIQGIAFNVPVPNGSCVDLTTELDQMPSVEEVNQVLKEESTQDPLGTGTLKARPSNLPLNFGINSSTILGALVVFGIIFSAADLLLLRSIPKASVRG